MLRRLEGAYAAGRLGFGIGLLSAPGSLGHVLLGEVAHQPAVRVTLRTYGTRDAVLGLCALVSLARRGSFRPWLYAGVLSDLLDAAVQATEWSDLPPDRRLLGMALALGAAAAGIGLLSRRPVA